MSAITIPYQPQLRREARAEWRVPRSDRGLGRRWCWSLLAGVLMALCYGGWPALKTFKFGFLTARVWNPVTEQFGALAALYGTVITSLIAMLIAVPLAFGIAVFLTETCPLWLRGADRDLHRVAGGGAEHRVRHLGPVRAGAGTAALGAAVADRYVRRPAAGSASCSADRPTASGC